MKKHPRTNKALNRDARKGRAPVSLALAAVTMSKVQTLNMENQITTSWAKVSSRIAASGGEEVAAGRDKETAVLRLLRQQVESDADGISIKGPDNQVSFNNWRIDLVCSNSHARVAIEGKYKTKSDGAAPDNRKAAFFDLHKLESYVASGEFTTGIFLWLTDCPSYLKQPQGDSHDFSTHQDRVYECGQELNAKRARERNFPFPFILNNSYQFHWNLVRDPDWYSLVLLVRNGS